MYVRDYVYVTNIAFSIAMYVATLNYNIYYDVYWYGKNTFFQHFC